MKSKKLSAKFESGFQGLQYDPTSIGLAVISIILSPVLQLVSAINTTKVWTSTFIRIEVLEDLRLNEQLHTRIERARSRADQPKQILIFVFFFDLVNLPDFTTTTKAYTFIKIIRKELSQPYKGTNFFSLFTAILALDKHKCNMLFGENNTNWGRPEECDRRLLRRLCERRLPYQGGAIIRKKTRQNPEVMPCLCLNSLNFSD